MTTNRRAAAAALAVACALPLVWPGDIPFINDEPLLIAGALSANGQHALAVTGLPGTFGFTYGPLPVWMYQALLVVTRNLVIVSVMHAVIVAVATAGALWWLARSLRLWPWFAAVPLLSPYFWFYARALWDNTLLIPLSAITIAAYAAHLTTESPKALCVAIAAALGMLLVHLMALALVLPLFAHMLSIRWRTLYEYRLAAGATTIIAALLAIPYAMHLAAAERAPVTTEWLAAGWMMPLLTPRLMTATELAYFFGAGPVGGTLLWVTGVVSTIAYGLMWCGLVIAATHLFRAIRSKAWPPITHIQLVLLTALLLQTLIDGISGKAGHPQYENATWIAAVLFAWISVDAFAARRTLLRSLALPLTVALAASLLVTVVVVAIRLHASGGTREVYGPTLANQQHVARQLSRYSVKSQLSRDVFPYDMYPDTLAVLRRLNPSPFQAPPGNLVIRYASTDPASGFIELVER